MAYRKRNRKFGRNKNQRRALLKGLALSLVTREKIKTTEAKARELRPFVEKLVTRARKGDLANRRLLISRLGSERGAAKLIATIAPRYESRTGGYTRIVKLPPRRSDGSRMALIEFV